MKKNVIFVLAVMAILLLAAGNGMAGMSNDTLDLSITLVSGCTVSTSGSVDLGTVDTYSGPAETPAGDVTITCDTGTPYDWGIDTGLNPYNGAGYDLLQLSNPTYPNSFVTVSLYVGDIQTGIIGDAGLSQIDPSYIETNINPSYGGAISQGTDTYSLLAWIDPITAGPDTGTYTDTVTVTVVW